MRSLSKRFLNVLFNDVRYQIKYGFYFLYAFFSVVYVVILKICPPEYRKTAAAIIILSDPAMLGCFFIGGIWLLEKNEGLHRFLETSPLRPMEYILSKAMSLALISAITANAIALFGLGHSVNYVTLSLAVFPGSAVFTIIGLYVASYAGSVNQYIALMSPLQILITMPAIVTALIMTHPVFEFFPGTALWHYIYFSLGGTDNAGTRPFVIILLWFGAVLIMANRRIPAAMQAETGEKI